MESAKRGTKPRKGGTANFKVSCRLNDWELQRLTRIVKKSGVSMAEYIRSRILKKQKPVVSLGEPVEDE